MGGPRDIGGGAGAAAMAAATAADTAGEVMTPAADVRLSLATQCHSFLVSSMVVKGRMSPLHTCTLVASPSACSTGTSRVTHLSCTRGTIR